jgi:hypothetical protein
VLIYSKEKNLSPQRRRENQENIKNGFSPLLLFLRVSASSAANGLVFILKTVINI